MKTLLTSSIVLMLLHCLHSCSGGEETSTNITDQFIEEIQTTLSEAEGTIHTFLTPSTIKIPLRGMAIPDCDLLVWGDHTDLSVVLLNKNGVERSRSGGFGRGPGEFEGIGRFHLGADERLYVMDPVLRRFNVYDLDLKNEELVYRTTIVPEPDLSLRLQEIYVTDLGYFGVFNQTTDYQSGENKYYLFRVNEAFRPVEQLLEMPGNEKIRLSEVFFIDDLVGQSTFWDVDGEWFYYITSHSPEINKYHLKTGERETVKYFSLGERENTPYNITFLKELLQTLIESNPPVGETIEESKTLPLFRNFLVQDGQILLAIYHAGGEHGVIIYVDQESEDVKYLKTPAYFTRLSIHNKTIYGIDTTPDDERHMIYMKFNL